MSNYLTYNYPQGYKLIIEKIGENCEIRMIYNNKMFGDMGRQWPSWFLKKIDICDLEHSALFKINDGEYDLLLYGSRTIRDIERVTLEYMGKVKLNIKVEKWLLNIHREMTKLCEFILEFDVDLKLLEGNTGTPIEIRGTLYNIAKPLDAIENDAEFLRGAEMILMSNRPENIDVVADKNKVVISGSGLKDLSLDYLSEKAPEMVIKNSLRPRIVLGNQYIRIGQPIE